MNRQYFLLILTCLCINNSSCKKSYQNGESDQIDYIDSNDNSNHNIYTSVTEDNFKSTMSQWMYKTDQKLEKLENNIQNFIPTIKDSIDLKFYKMIESLENYLNTKLNLINTELLNKINENLNALEKKLPVPEQNIAVKLEVLEKKLEDCKAKKCESFDEYIPQIIENINRTIEVLESKLPDNLIRNINFKLEMLKNKMPVLEANLTSMMNLLGKKIPDNFENNIVNKLDVIQKRIPDLEEKLTTKLDALEIMLPKIKENCQFFNQSHYDLENNLQNKLNSLITLEEKLLKKVNTSEDNGCKNPCDKVAVVRGYNFDQFYEIERDAFHHVIVQRDSKGITVFEMNIAVMSDDVGIIMLSEKPHPGPDDRVFEIVLGVGDNDHTDLRRKKSRDSVLHLDTPKILYPYKFTAFFIKISFGKLQVGYKGKEPFLSYNDSELALVKYFSFASWDNKEANFRFDCDAM